MNAAARDAEGDGLAERESLKCDAPSQDPEPTPPSWRRRYLGWVYRPLDYLRRFALSPVLHRIDRWRAEADAWERRAEDRHGEAAAWRGQTTEQLDAILSAINRGELAQPLKAALKDIETRQAGHAAALAQLEAQLLAGHRDVRSLLSIVGPRFDELEIKVRPLITFDAESYAVRLADGYAMVPRDEPSFALQVVNAPSGGLESGTRRVLQALALPGMTVADVGANVGLLTLALARATGPGGRVFAFEPEPRPLRQLEKTIALNGLSWVATRAVAAGARRGRATFHMSPIIGHSSLYELPAAEQAGERTLEVEVWPLDEAIPLGTPLDVVKIDVEGAELDVLAGMAGRLQANRDIALVAEFGPSHLERIGIAPRTWWDAFKAHGFTAFEIEEPTGLCRPIALKAALARESVNLAFVRKGGAAQARLPQA